MIKLDSVGQIHRNVLRRLYYMLLRLLFYFESNQDKFFYYSHGYRIPIDFYCIFYKRPYIQKTSCNIFFDSVSFVYVNKFLDYLFDCLGHFHLYGHTVFYHLFQVPKLIYAWIVDIYVFPGQHKKYFYLGDNTISIYSTNQSLCHPREQTCHTFQPKQSFSWR